MKTTNTTNQFDFIATEGAQTADNRRLNHTGQLINLSKQRAAELLQFVASAESEDKAQYIDAIDGGRAEDLMLLFGLKFDSDMIKADAAFLGNATEDELSKLLESRRSDRSKKLKEGPRSSVMTCQSYLAAMYAEMLVREAWNKPYAAGTIEHQVDESDLVAITKKIKSLQSKKSRLKKSAQYDQADAEALKQVEDEIARLSSFRPTVSAKVVVKSAETETVREALKLIDQSKLDAATLDKLQKAGLL